MPTYTTRNDLEKPGYADAADISIINANMDIIDASLAKGNYTASTAPTVNDDNLDGYSAGSLWIDTTAHNVYACESAATGAAVWKLVNSAAGAVVSASDPTVNDDSGDGYVRGQMWVNSTSKQVFIATDVTLGAAVWRKMLAADGTVPLTANWDAGNFEVRSSTFQSDVATGTAPFIVASTTMVANLNAATCGDADTLDTKHASDFVLQSSLTGFTVGSGGNIGVAGTAVSSQAGINYIVVPTDPANDSAGMNMSQTPTYTGAETASESYYGLSLSLNPIVNTSHNNSGKCTALFIRNLRNYAAADVNDGGTLNELFGMSFSYGHYNNDAAETPLTTNAYGIRLLPYYRTGTITNLYGMYIGAPTTGGTATNSFAMYSAWNAPSYFAGNLETAGVFTQSATSGTNTFKAPYTTFGNGTAGSTVLWVPVGWATNPTADNWYSRCNSIYKDDLGVVDVASDRTTRFSARASLESVPIHNWIRKLDPEVEYGHVLSRWNLSSEVDPATSIEAEYEAHKSIEYKSTLHSFNVVNTTPFAEDVPENCKGYDEQGNLVGVSSMAYTSWVHQAVAAMHADMVSLEMDLADIDYIIWEKEAEVYALKAKLEEQDARMAKLEARLAKLEGV